MGGNTFDLVGTISDLLRRIEEGRKTIRETQNVRDEFWRICANRDDALRHSQELQLKMLSLGEPAKSEAKAEFDFHVAEYHRLDSESSDLWRQSNDTLTFIDPFGSDVLLLLERLPLRPEWDVYRDAVGAIDVSADGSWKDPPTTSALGTLEMRLREMLDLATPKQRGPVRRFDPFPTPDGARWKDVSITFISEHRVQIAVLRVIETRSYAEMGFEDRRGGGGKPDGAWERLKVLAKASGRIERPSDFKRPGWPKVEKQVQVIRARLRELFCIAGDPLPFRKHIGYEAQFRIKLSNSVGH